MHEFTLLHLYCFYRNTLHRICGSCWRYCRKYYDIFHSLNDSTEVSCVDKAQAGKKTSKAPNINLKLRKCCGMFLSLETILTRLTFVPKNQYIKFSQFLDKDLKPNFRC